MANIHRAKEGLESVNRAEISVGDSMLAEPAMIIRLVATIHKQKIDYTIIECTYYRLCYNLLRDASMINLSLIFLMTLSLNCTKETGHFVKVYSKVDLDEDIGTRTKRGVREI
ncbi:hypothetical protein RU07_22405 [Agrobacterium tumefaciens]|uniref:Uncharacterized protein n=1 Tax=Agrobacterium tumefaciens TaxID=358 RepID=A0A0D0IY54_AGRTU|nr:hypothetical protein RU07_22405 [Agrobacterium tumefaciens]